MVRGRFEFDGPASALLVLSDRFCLGGAAEDAMKPLAAVLADVELMRALSEKMTGFSTLRIVYENALKFLRPCGASVAIRRQLPPQLAPFLAARETEDSR